MTISIIVPVFNEEKTVIAVLEKLKKLNLEKSNKEIIVVDDGSTDNTPFLIDKYLKTKGVLNIVFHKHKKNLGKGSAVKSGIAHATGDYVIIQDADLEYNSEDIKKLVTLISPTSQVIYGTRLNRLPNIFKEEKELLFLLHFIGNRGLSLVTSILYGQWITDMETCYKLFPRKALENINLRARGFEFEPEITAKLMKLGYKIRETPITTTPRGYKEGKKLHTISDGTRAVWSLLKYRFVN